MHSDLVTFNASLELDLAEPVVVGRLCLVPPVPVENSCATEVGMHWFVQQEVDDGFLLVSAS